MMKLRALVSFVLAFGFFLLSSRAALAASPDDTDRAATATTKPAPDYLMPRAGEFSGTIASGIPFLGSGEVAYGATDRFALGVVIGVTPDIGTMSGTAAIGLRPRVVVWQSGAWRSTLTAPVLFYPDIKGFGAREPWMLARPTLALERELGRGARVNVTMGVIGAACMDSIITLGKEHTMEGGVWNTVGVGGALPVSKSTSVFAEGSLIMSGVVPAENWIGGTPVVAFAGITTTL
jgi:hypothetical protein